MSTLSAGEMFLAIALIIGLATACQVIAPLLKMPSLILLLPVGFLLGLMAPGLRITQVLGPAFPVVVDLVVALILFQGGMALGNIRLQDKDKTVVRRLVWIGGAISFLGATLAAHFLLSLSWPVAFILGAILVVSGPTVVTPILEFAQPSPRVRGILLWEGTTLDPLGAILAVVVFQIVRATDSNTTLEAIGTVLFSLLVAVVMAAIGVVLMILGIRAVHRNYKLGTQVIVGTVLVCAGIANYLAPESGLLTALMIGIAAPRLAIRFGSTLEPVTPFFDTIASIGIGVLFISIAALVPSPVVASIAIPAICVALVLILVVRPLIALVCTARARLSANERAFIGWMDPRGIVAAATASSVGASLVAAHVTGGEKLLPAAFVIIAVTVFVYGLTAVPVAAALGLRSPEPATQAQE